MKRRHEYAVRYRRHGWPYRQVRFYQSLPPAIRLVWNLRKDDPRWAPIAEITVERREVGEWIEVDL